MPNKAEENPKVEAPELRAKALAVVIGDDVVLVRLGVVLDVVDGVVVGVVVLTTGEV